MLDRNLVSYFCIWTSNFPSTIFKEIVLTPGTVILFVKYSLDANAWNDFWNSYSVPMVYRSAFVAVPGCFDYCPGECPVILYCDVAGFLFVFLRFFEQFGISFVSIRILASFF